MKIYAWILIAFSSLACFGLLSDTSDSAMTGSNLLGFAYGVAVIVFCGMYVQSVRK